MLPLFSWPYLHSHRSWETRPRSWTSLDKEKPAPEESGLIQKADVADELDLAPSEAPSVDCPPRTTTRVRPTPPVRVKPAITYSPQRVPVRTKPTVIRYTPPRTGVQTYTVRKDFKPVLGGQKEVGPPLPVNFTPKSEPSAPSQVAAVTPNAADVEEKIRVIDEKIANQIKGQEDNNARIAEIEPQIEKAAQDIEMFKKDQDSLRENILPLDRELKAAQAALEEFNRGLPATYDPDFLNPLRDPNLVDRDRNLSIQQNRLKSRVTRCQETFRHKWPRHQKRVES